MGPTAMHMSPYCINVLISLVQSGSQPMESVFETFTNHFQAPGARFQARCLYAYLLKQNVLEDVRERIAAIFILRHGYLCELPSFPFLHVFLQLAEVARGSGQVRADACFLRALLTSTTESFKNSTSMSIAEAFDGDVNAPVVHMPRLAASQNDPPYLTASLQCALPVSFVKVRQKESHTSLCDLPPDIPLSSTWKSTEATGEAPDCEQQHCSTPDFVAPVARQRNFQSNSGGQVLSRAAGIGGAGGFECHGFAPSFPRPLPPLSALTNLESATVQPSIANSLIWDDSGEVAPACLAQLQQLLLDAQSKPLQPIQHKEFLLALESWPRLVHHIGFCPTQLPALVEHNNMVAVDLLLKLIETSSPRITAFLDVLVHMDLSVHSMEVVKTLTSAASLSEEFIHRYINSCIAACEAIEQRTTKQQNRPVRLVCVFLQSLIRTKIVDVRAIQYEVLSFCVKFSRIREAASLFRLLQNLNDPSTTSASPVKQLQ